MHSVGHTRFTFGLLQLLVAAVCAFCSLRVPGVSNGNAV